MVFVKEDFLYQETQKKEDVFGDLSDDNYKDHKAH